MKCQDCVEFLDDYISGELAPEQRRVFEEHTGLCPPCLTYLESYRATRDLGVQCCAAEPVLELPDALVRAIVAARAKPS